MIVLSIETEKDVHNISKFNDMINDGNNIFILLYMEGCGPCNATRPEWTKMTNVLKEQYKNNNNLVIISINNKFQDKISQIGSVDGYPTIKYIGNYGKIVEAYEDSSISKKDRSLDSFVNWVESKINKVESSSSPEKVFKRLNRKKTIKSSKNKKNKTNKTNKTKSIYKGGKWSEKYKASIDCNHPKGFSQKQHCKYGRKK